VLITLAVVDPNACRTKNCVACSSYLTAPPPNLLIPYKVVFEDRKRKIHIYDYDMGAASLGRWTARSTAQWAAIIGEGLMEGVEVEPEGQGWARDFFTFCFNFVFGLFVNTAHS
jgi:hypothetical protein